MPAVTWNPSETYKADARLPIAAPPCPGCKNWQPAQQFSPRGEYLGVRLCQAEEMAVDFSCFMAKAGES
jgi:hypothetical protein